jgi:hypothetical protein
MAENTTSEPLKDENAPEPAPAPTRTPLWQRGPVRVAAGAAALLLAAGLGATAVAANQEVNEPMAATPTLPPTPTPTPAPTTSAAPDPDLSPRGHIMKDLGEVGGLSHPDDLTPSLEELVLSFSIDAIRVDAPCTSEYAEEPENGHFVALDIRASTTENYPADVYYFNMNPTTFSFVGSDGVFVQNIATTPTYGCMDYDDPNLFPSATFTPASSYRGTVILDIPETSGTLIWTPMGGTSGWEWQIG